LNHLTFPETIKKYLFKTK